MLSLFRLILKLSPGTALRLHWKQNTEMRTFRLTLVLVGFAFCCVSSKGEFKSLKLLIYEDRNDL